MTKSQGNNIQICICSATNTKQFQITIVSVTLLYH